MLLSSFKFELSDKHVYWNLAGVQYPSVDSEGNHPELPTKVTSLKKEPARL